MSTTTRIRCPRKISPTHILTNSPPALSTVALLTLLTTSASSVLADVPPVDVCVSSNGRIVYILDAGDTCRRGYESVALSVQGAQGPAGPQGDNGLTGAQGPQGDNGLTGAQGPQGDTGLTGAQGQQGDTGLTGAQGPQGDTGSQGPAGIDGATGLQGSAGADGATGAQGLTGVIETTRNIDTCLSLDPSSHGITFDCTANCPTVDDTVVGGGCNIFDQTTGWVLTGGTPTFSTVDSYTCRATCQPSLRSSQPQSNCLESGMDAFVLCQKTAP